MEKQKNSVGRRKEAVTRVFVTRGSGSITVNDKDYKQYFSLVYLQNQVIRPLKTVEATDKFDIKINAAGGGVKGQAEAAMLGIARVLVDLNPDFRPALKAAGLLKRDPRSVERKKFGKKKARKSFQFSKR
jgi:small subunit ribosomal protein S9